MSAAVLGLGGIRAARLRALAVGQTICGAKKTQDVVDLSLEMMDIDAPDTGKHQAMVVQDPTDKRNIGGFVHLALIYSETIEAMERRGFESHCVLVWRLRSGFAFIGVIARNSVTKQSP